MLTRRRFLTTTAAAALPLAALSPSVAAAAAGQSRLVAAPARVQIAPPGYPATGVWAYDGRIPGTPLRFRQGDRLDLRFVNGLEEPSTIHWHGLRLPNAMDGVPYFTQAPVAPGESFDYRFTLRDAGTFWYHPHVNSLEQLSRGLAGALVIDEAEPPDVDHDETVVLQDWRMTAEAQIHASFDNRHDMSHAGRLGNYVTVNALPELRLGAAPGTRLRLRLINTAPARIFRLRLAGVRGWVMALDGMPLEAPRQVEALTLAPAQRADLFVDITGEGDAFIASVERDGIYALASFEMSGPARAMRAAPPALPPNDLPAIALAGARRAPLVIEGGAMRGLPEGAVHKGAAQGFRSLAEAGQFWALSGVAGMAEAPFLSAAPGETLRIPMTNRTAFPHAMHLHGMHFRELLAGGGLGPWRDTLLIAPDETREIAFVAETPGDWMFHCHMPAHQMSGMMTWIRVG